MFSRAVSAPAHAGLRVRQVVRLVLHQRLQGHGAHLQPMYGRLRGRSPAVTAGDTALDALSSTKHALKTSLSICPKFPEHNRSPNSLPKRRDKEGEQCRQEGPHAHTDFAGL